jgi:hypothetical protein
MMEKAVEWKTQDSASKTEFKSDTWTQKKIFGPPGQMGELN